MLRCDPELSTHFTQQEVCIKELFVWEDMNQKGGVNRPWPPRLLLYADPSPTCPRTWCNDVAEPGGTDTPLASGSRVPLKASICFTFSEIEPLGKKSGSHRSETTLQDDMKRPCREGKALRLIGEKKRPSRSNNPAKTPLATPIQENNRDPGI